MKVSATHLQNTLLQLFNDLQLAAGDPVRLQRLEQFWAATTLRRADLLQGIAQLAAGALLEISGEDHDTWLALTGAGHAAMLEVDAAGWKRQFNEQLLPALRRRQLAPDEDGRGRRSYEQRAEAHIPWPSR